MAFKYVLDSGNYEDLASGRVIYNQKGTTAFPVRLASEIFLRCVSLLRGDGLNEPFILYDPLCGGAYMLTALGFLHGESIKRIYASDIDDNAVLLAEKNLSLLYEPGISNRIRQLEQMLEEYKKPSHAEALLSALRLQKRVEELAWDVEPVCFAADATENNNLNTISEPVDVVIADLPYGDIVQWESSEEYTLESGHEPGSRQSISPGPEIQRMLNSLLRILNPKAVVAIISREKLGAVHGEYRRVQHFKHGRRYITIFRPESFHRNYA